MSNPTFGTPAVHALRLVFAVVATTSVLHAQGTGTVVSPVDEGKRVEATNGVVTAANGLASEAGVQMLRAGGNAVDAIVATAFAVGVVEPQMSGLGGSGSATIWMKSEGKPAYLDFYAAQPVDAWRGRTQPAAAGRGGRGAAQPPTGGRGGRGGRGAAPADEGTAAAAGDMTVVGVPGGVGGLLALHEKYGVLPREQVLAPAILLADDGFPIGQILAGFIAGAENSMRPYPRALALYFPDGNALGPGDVLKNPDLVTSLRRIAKDGRKGFYEGPTAAGVVAVLNAGGNPTRASDLAKYEPQWKRPLCTDYRGYTIVTAAPPQTGYQVLHALELLEPFNLKALGLPTQSARAFDVMVSALRAAQAQTRYNSDPNWVAVPANGLSSGSFAATRKALIGTGIAADSMPTDDPTPFDQAAPAGECGRYEPYGAATPIPGASRPGPLDLDAGGERAEETDGETTHMSAVDKDGNAVSLTITNSSVWGSGGFAEGFFLNNSGFRFTDGNIDAPTRSPWRIRNTTIAPTIVMKDGQVQVVIGAPGGGRIPTEILQVLVYVLDYGLDPLDAVKLPRIFTSPRNLQVQLEHGFTPELLREIRAMRYEPVAEAAGYARLYLIARRGDVWIGVADPRHDGQPRGY
jgi:gamma-glutamyltranspeptidase/glutathione hydrolase